MTKKEAFGVYVNYMYNGGYKADSVPTKEVLQAREELELYGIDLPALSGAIEGILAPSGTTLIETKSDAKLVLSEEGLTIPMEDVVSATVDGVKVETAFTEQESEVALEKLSQKQTKKGKK